MYQPSYFVENDRDTILSFIRVYPFAVLVCMGENGMPEAANIPLLVTEKEGGIFLSGHVMKKTKHHQALLLNPSVLAVFNGPHAYVSASWYQQPQSASNMTVQASGCIRLLDDKGLLDVLKRTTRMFETPDSPSLVEDMTADYLSSNMKAIVAFELEVTDLKATFKLSQNKDKLTQQHIIQKLNESEDAGAKAIADEMRKRLTL